MDACIILRSKRSSQVPHNVGYPCQATLQDLRLRIKRAVMHANRSTSINKPNHKQHNPMHAYPTASGIKQITLDTPAFEQTSGAPRIPCTASVLVRTPHFPKALLPPSWSWIVSNGLSSTVLRESPNTEETPMQSTPSDSSSRICVVGSSWTLMIDLLPLSEN